jgi:predicted component of type VI protein secretion system
LKVLDIRRTDFERLASNPRQLKDLINSAGSKGQRCPVSLVVADFEVGSESVQFIADVAQAAQSTLAPVLLNASPDLLGLADWRDSPLALRLDEHGSDPENVEWQALTNHEDSKFICLACSNFHPTTTFSAAGQRHRFRYTQPPSHGDEIWIRAAWGVAARIHDATYEQGLPYRAEGMAFGSIPDSGSVKQMSIDGREVDCGAVQSHFPEPDLQALVRCGVSPLFQTPGSSGSSVYFLPSLFRTQDVAPTRCRFLEVICGTRLVHHLVAQCGHGDCSKSVDGTFDDVVNFLANYVLVDPKPSQEMYAKYPLVESSVKIIRSADDEKGTLLIQFRFQSLLFAGKPTGTLQPWTTLGFTRELLSFFLTDLVLRQNRLKN